MGSIGPLVVLLSAVSPIAAQLALPPADNPLFEAGSWPSGALDIAVADVNSDGFPDWVAIDDSPAALTVALNSGHMRFGVKTLPLDGYATEITTGDLDADGQPDLVTLANFPWAFTTRVGDGLGGFTPVDAVPTPIKPVTPRLADLDGDGLPEALALALSTGELLVLHGQGGGQLAVPVPYAAGAATYGYALGDLDGDGDLDALVSATPHLRRLDGDGSGGFSGPVELASTAPPVTAIELGDTDGDGDLDAAALVIFDQLALFLGDGHGGFASAGVQTAGLQSEAIAMADMNLDGHADVLVANGVGDVTVFTGGAGTLSFAWSTVIGHLDAMQPLALAAADFNLDGKPDVACTLQDQFSWKNQTVVLRGLGTGVLAGASVYPLTGWWAIDSRLADLSGDGINDLLTIQPGDSSPGGVSWRRGTGTGGFLAEQFTPLPNAPQAVATADLDADGDVDVALTHASSENGAFVAWIKNSGGALGPVVSVPLGDGYTAGVAVGDLDSDGAVDLVVAHVFPANLHVLLGDGAGGFGASVDWVPGITPSDLLLHDFDQDGALDLLVAGLAGVSIHLGDGAGGLGPFTNYGGAGALASLDPALADFDEDGDSDVLVHNEEGGLGLYRGDGAGGLLPAVVSDVGVVIKDFEAADIDGDQHLDLIAVSDGLLTLERGAGDGTFAAAGSYDTVNLAQTVTLGRANSDQRLDAVVTAAYLAQVLVHFNVYSSMPWVSLGGGLGGAAGVPVLTGNGPLTPGSQISLNLQKAAPSSPCALFLGMEQGLLPFKGGTLVPAAVILLPLVTNAAGKLSLSGPWPPGLPSGLTLLAQMWVHDPSAPHGAAGSGCEVGLVP